MIISHEDRAHYRAALRQLDNLISTSTSIISGQLAMTADLQRVLYTLTKTSDPREQLRALTDMREMTYNDYRDALLIAAREDLSAFHEYCNPSEPPAKVHIVLCETIHRVINGEAQRLMVNMPPGHAKPLDVATRVLMADGAVKLLGEIEVGDFVITAKGRAREVLAVHDQGVLPAVKITTEGGREVIAGLDHGFLTPRGFVQAKDLKPGSRLGFPSTYEIADTSGRSHDEFALAGYLMAFCYVRQRLMSRQKEVGDPFNAPSTAVFADLLAICQRLGLDHHISKRVNYNSMVEMITFGKSARDWMRDAELTGTRWDMPIPEWVFKGDRDRIAAFIGALFSCDAEFRMVRNKHTGAACKFHIKTHLPAQAEGLQRLLARLGINGQVSERFTTNYNYRPRTLYYVTLARAVDLYRLITTVRLPRGLNVEVFDDDSIPFGVEVMAEDKVASVEVHAPRPMCCITVEEDQTFLAEGLIVHNSTYCSVDFPAWWIGHNAGRKFLQAGHTQGFCEKQFGRRVKNLVASKPYSEVFPDVTCDPDAANGYWIASNNAEYATLGVGQGISGFRAHLASVDDPYKNVEDAENPGVRDTTWDWLTTDFMLRLMPECPLFIVSTRWHLDDVCGRFLKKQDSPDEVVLYPFERVILDAVCEDPDFDPLNRQYGEPLWEEVFSRRFLEDKRNTLDIARWHALYLQRPINPEGNLLKAEHVIYTDSFPGDLDARGNCPIPKKRCVVSVDTADKETRRSDYTAIGVWIEDHSRNYYLKYVRRDRFGFDALAREIKLICEEHSADTLLIEDKGAGTQIISHFKTNPDKAPPAAVIAVSPGQKSKAFRFDACLPLFAAGRVHIARRGRWVSSYVSELLEFPSAANDDQVDMTSQALSYLAKTAQKRGTEKLGRRRLSPEEQAAEIAEKVRASQATPSGMIAG